MGQPLHIGINTLFCIPGEVGGTEVYLRGILPHLAADPTLRLTLFTNRENHDSLDAYPRVPIAVSARQRPARLLAEQTLLPHAARRAGCAVLWNPGYTAPFFPPCPQVTTVHDCQWRALPADFGLAARAAHEIFVGLALRRAEAVSTVSDFSRQELAHHFRVEPGSIAVTHEGWDPAFVVQQPSPFDTPYFLSVSNTYPHKNAARLVEAFDSVADTLPHALVLVGQAGRGEPPPHPRVLRVHRLPLEGLIGAMQHAEALFFPSLYEGFGLPVLEGMAAGVPVFASDRGSIPEVGGDAIRYFDPTDTAAMAAAFRTAASDTPETRARFVAAGRARAARFSWFLAAERLAIVLKRTASGKSSGEGNSGS